MSDSEQLSKGGELIKLIVQLDQLQTHVAPHLPAVSRKLVSDLLSTGTPAKNIARSLGRSPGYIQAVAGGKKSLSAGGVVRLLKFAASVQKATK